MNTDLRANRILSSHSLWPNWKIVLIGIVNETTISVYFYYNAWNNTLTPISLYKSCKSVSWFINSFWLSISYNQSLLSTYIQNENSIDPCIACSLHRFCCWEPMGYVSIFLSADKILSYFCLFNKDGVGVTPLADITDMVSLKIIFISLNRIVINAKSYKHSKIHLLIGSNIKHGFGHGFYGKGFGLHGKGFGYGPFGHGYGHGFGYGPYWG